MWLIHVALRQSSLGTTGCPRNGKFYGLDPLQRDKRGDHRIPTGCGSCDQRLAEFAKLSQRLALCSLENQARLLTILCTHTCRPPPSPLPLPPYPTCTVSYVPLLEQAPAGATAPQPAPQTASTAFTVPSIAQSGPVAAPQPQQYTYTAATPRSTDSTRAQAPTGLSVPKTRFGPAPTSVYVTTPSAVQESQARQDYPGQAQPQQPGVIPAQMPPGQADPNRNDQSSSQDPTRRDAQVGPYWATCSGSGCVEHEHHFCDNPSASKGHFFTWSGAHVATRYSVAEIQAWRVSPSLLTPACPMADSVKC